MKIWQKEGSLFISATSKETQEVIGFRKNQDRSVLELGLDIPSGLFEEEEMVALSIRDVSATAYGMASFVHQARVRYKPEGFAFITSLSRKRPTLSKEYEKTNYSW